MAVVGAEAAGDGSGSGGDGSTAAAGCGGERGVGAHAPLACFMFNSKPHTRAACQQPELSTDTHA
jgi:hypothetical protein